MVIEMFYALVVIIGFILILVGIIGFVVAIADYNFPSTIGVIFLAIAVCGGYLLLFGMNNAITYTIEDIAVDHKFIDKSYSNPVSGFIDANNTEYYYKNDMIIEINHTYKMKIRHNNELNERYVEYIYI